MDIQTHKPRPLGQLKPAPGQLRPAAAKAPVARPDPAAPQLGDEWMGNWTGPLEVSGGAYDGQKLPMSLRIAPKVPDRGSYAWEIQYGDEPVRPYELKPADDHWVIDEKNGIVIDTYEVGDLMTSQFEINHLRVTANYELKGDELHLEMRTFSRDPVSHTGTDRFPVESFALASLQRAVLRREDQQQQGQQLDMFR